MSNIIQVEFFLIKDEGQSLEEFQTQARRRAMEDLSLELLGVSVRRSIKPCIRFVDYSGRVTREIRKEESIIEQYNRLFSTIPHHEGWRRTFQFWKVNRAAKAMRRWESTRAKRMFTHVQTALRNKEVVAVDDIESRFAPLPFEETYDYLTTCSRSENVWVFVFAPNELCADQQQVIAKLI